MDQQVSNELPALCHAYHIIIVSLAGLNTLLTTWLTLRAKRKDNEENGKVRRYR